MCHRLHVWVFLRAVILAHFGTTIAAVLAAFFTASLAPCTADPTTVSRIKALTPIFTRIIRAATTPLTALSSRAPRPDGFSGGPAAARNCKSAWPSMMVPDGHPNVLAGRVQCPYNEGFPS